MKPTYEELVQALGQAIEAFQYASMTAWERDVTSVSRLNAQRVYEAAKVEVWKDEHAKTVDDAREACIIGGVLEREPRN